MAALSGILFLENRNERRTVNPLFEEDSNTTDLCPPDPSTLPMPQSFMKGVNFLYFGILCNFQPYSICIVHSLARFYF